MTTKNTPPKSETPDPAALQAGTLLGERLAEQTLFVQSKDVLDRIVELGHDARQCDGIDLKLDTPIHGLPDKITVIVKHRAGGPEIMGVRDLFKPYETAPERRCGTAHVTTLESFIALANRHKDESSVIFAKTDWPAPSLTAVLNYHETDGKARYRDHRVAYAFPLTKEFQAWMAGDGKKMDQSTFALFLEDHLQELAAPYEAEVTEYERLFKERMATPMDVLALSRGLEVHVGAKVKRQERVASGERTIQFETTHTDAVGEPVTIPGVFMVSVAAFVDGEALRMPARLRYRIGAGELVWFYQLYRPETWLRERVLADLQAAAVETGLPAFEGAPE